MCKLFLKIKKKITHIFLFCMLLFDFKNIIQQQILFWRFILCICSKYVCLGAHFELLYVMACSWFPCAISQLSSLDFTKILLIDLLWPQNLCDCFDIYFTGEHRRSDCFDIHFTGGHRRTDCFDIHFTEEHRCSDLWTLAFQIVRLYVGNIQYVSLGFGLLSYNACLSKARCCFLWYMYKSDTDARRWLNVGWLLFYSDYLSFSCVAYCDNV